MHEFMLKVKICPCSHHQGIRGRTGTVILDAQQRRVSNFTSQPLYHVERANGTHWTRAQVNPTACLDLLEKQKSTASTTNWTPDHPASTLGTTLNKLSCLLDSRLF